MGQIALDLQSDLFVLPAPVVAPQISLAKALRQRRSVHAFSIEAVSAETLSALLWAAFGINRASTGTQDFVADAPINLATVVRGLVDRRRLAHDMGLRPTQRIVLTQTVGWPAD